MTQFSLFGAAVSEPELADLDGVLLAGGHWVRSGQSARLSVVVADPWRAAALAREFGVRGVAAAPEAPGVPGAPEASVATSATSATPGVFPPPAGVATAAGAFAVRTAFTAELTPLATRWTRGANEAPPPDLVLTPGGLRLWVVANGRREDAGYLLATAEPDDATHLAAGAQLSRLGLAAVSISNRARPGWRVTSARRIRRLVELLGPPPLGAGRDWPTVR